MEKEINKESIEEIVEKINGSSEDIDAVKESVAIENADESAAFDAADQAEESVAESEPDIIDPPTTSWKAYVPKFTEASERYRYKGDARIRERLGIKFPSSTDVEGNPDEIKLDPTAEFEEDFAGVEAKTPENSSVDESDESLSVFKFSSNNDEELDPETEKEREEIKKLLRSAPAPEPVKEEPIDETPVLEEEPEEIEEEPVSKEEYSIPDPEKDDLGVFDFASGTTASDEDEDAPDGVDESAPVASNAKAKRKDNEFNNPAQRDSIKDKFLDSLISIRIRTGASLIFAFAILVMEILSATKVLSFKLFETSGSYSLLGIVDFLLAACIFVMSLPEIVKAAKHLVSKKITPDLLPVPAFIIFGLYTFTLHLTGATSYALFGLLFASVTIPVMTAALYRTKADFIAFKMISQNEDKSIIDRKNTRELVAENIALDGVIDEYKSKIARTFRTAFISDFFKNTSGVAVDIKHIGMIFGVPFGVGVVASAAAYFLSWNPVTAVAVLALVVMLGCPAVAILSSKVSYFHSQRAALLSDSTAIGEDAYHNFSSVDVFAFDDTDIFGPDDVNLKRFMLYGERDSMEKVMRQMCALFAAVGGPLDYMFSNAIDNRVRHKSATNLVVEDDGICGEVAGHKICAGSQEYMRRNGIAIPSAATAPESGVSFDTIKVMYAAEDGEVYAKFYIRYSFSEEFTSTLPSLREAGITPLVYTRDPNISNELLETLTTGASCMRVLKLYSPLKEEKVYSRVSSSMVTYGDKLDAASVIILSKKYNKFSLHVKFAELCAAAVGIILAIVLSIIGFGRVTVVIATLWQIIMCGAFRFISKAVFLKDARKKEEE